MIKYCKGLTKWKQIIKPEIVQINDYVIAPNHVLRKNQPSLAQVIKIFNDGTNKVSLRCSDGNVICSLDDCFIPGLLDIELESKYLN